MSTLNAPPPSPDARDATRGDIYELIAEGNDVRKRFHSTWDDAARLVESDHYANEPRKHKELERFTLNRTNRSVVALAAVLTDTRPRISVKPVEGTGDELIYLDGQAGAALTAQGVQLPSIQPEQLQGTAPLLMPQAQALLQSQIIGEQALHRVGDATVAQALEQINEQMWERAGADFTLTLSAQHKLIYGHQPIVCDWSEAEHRWRLSLPHVQNVWIDPDALYVDDAQWLVLAERMDARRAAALFPGAERIIAEQAGEGPTTNIHADAELGSPFDTNYRREMVIVMTSWVRDEIVDLPVPPREALRNQLVALNEGNEFINQRGQVVTWAGPGWPTMPGRGIRQTKWIGDVKVDDRACPFRDIPMSWDVNIPRSYTAYGMGEPELLSDLQRAINRVMSILVNHMGYFQSPTEMIPASVKQALGSNADSLYSFPGRRMTVPDDIWLASGGKPSMFQFPPALNESYLRFFAALLSEFDRFSGNTNAIQGQSDPNAESGRAIRFLQDAAKGVIGYRAKWTERAVQTLAKLQLGMIVDFLPPDEWSRYAGKWPSAVLSSIRSRAKSLRYDVTAEIAAGKGQHKRERLEEAIMIRRETQGQVPSIRTLLEQTDSLDGEDELRRSLEEQAGIAQAAAQAAGAGQQAGQDPDQRREAADQQADGR